LGATCVFDLNKKQLSVLQCDGGGVPGTLPAFSGQGVGRDNPDEAARADVGPLPKGLYYIVDRQSGGHLGWLRDLAGRLGLGTTDHTQWFMLWNAASGDSTFVGKVKRGAFRLHPIGPLGLSEGCITVTDVEGFNKLAAALRRSGPNLPVPGTTMKAYGTVEVR
jgi:hypothetical protein